MSFLQTLLRRPFRPYFFALFALAVVELCFGALYLQGALRLDPCPLCILQRYGLLAIGIVGLIGTLHNRAPRIYGALVTLVALAGGGVAAWQSWLQANPAEIATCGPGIGRMVNELAFARWWPHLFEATGECGAADWTLFGLSIAHWGLVTFCGIIAVTLWLTLRRTPGTAK